MLHNMLYFVHGAICAQWRIGGLKPQCLSSKLGHRANWEGRCPIELPSTACPGLFSPFLFSLWVQLNSQDLDWGSGIIKKKRVRPAVVLPMLHCLFHQDPDTNSAQFGQKRAKDNGKLIYSMPEPSLNSVLISSSGMPATVSSCHARVSISFRPIVLLVVSAIFEWNRIAHTFCLWSHNRDTIAWHFPFTRLMYL